MSRIGTGALLACCVATVGIVASQAAPQKLAPGVISLAEVHDDYVTLTPDGQVAAFTRLESGYRGGTLHLASRRAGGWVDLGVAPFSGRHQDSRATFSPDGRRLYFSSNRPHPDRESDRRDLDIWYVERDGAGWTEPVRVAAVNTDAHESHPSLARSGALDFVRRTDDSDI